jgi:hypothetical protein
MKTLAILWLKGTLFLKLIATQFIIFHRVVKSHLILGGDLPCRDEVERVVEGTILHALCPALMVFFTAFCQLKILLDAI